MKITKLQIALDQLERAIRLLMDDKDDISAITLAGAADEILGSIVDSKGMEPAFKTEHKFTTDVIRIMQDRDASYDEVKELLIGVRNGLKHHRKESMMEFDEHSAAIDLIDRAVENAELLEIDRSEQVSRFLDYKNAYYS